MLKIQTAYVASREGRWDDVDVLCRQILAELPHERPAYWLLALSLLRRGRAAEAAELTAQALAMAPHDSDLLIVRGQALAMLGRSEEAIATLTDAIEQRLINPAAHAALSAVLVQRADPTPRFTVSVITPTVGTAVLAAAIASVQAQNYPLLEHVIVADGPEHHDRVRGMLPGSPRHPVHLLALPANTGGGGFCGHRVYGAAPYLVEGMYVMFLDEDNWLEPDHVASLMGKITAEGLAWAYSLRRIVDAEGRFIANDDCESLGQWQTWSGDNMHLVDANCYALRRDLAIQVSPLWYRRGGDVVNPDYAICEQLLAQQPHCGTTGRYTVNYRVGVSANTTDRAAFFEKGNTAMRIRFKDGLPWRAKDLFNVSDAK